MSVFTYEKVKNLHISTYALFYVSVCVNIDRMKNKELLILKPQHCSVLQISKSFWMQLFSRMESFSSLHYIYIYIFFLLAMPLPF